MKPILITFDKDCGLEDGFDWLRNELDAQGIGATIQEIDVPRLTAGLTGCAEALRLAGQSFAQNNPNAARPNLFELHEREARTLLEELA